MHRQAMNSLSLPSSSPSSPGSHRMPLDRTIFLQFTCLQQPYQVVYLFDVDWENDKARILRFSDDLFPGWMPGVVTLPLWSPSPSKNARRTQRVSQWYQRVREGSTNWARAVAIGDLQVVPSTCGTSSRSVKFDLRPRPQRSPSLSAEFTSEGRADFPVRVFSCRLASQCVSFLLSSFRPGKSWVGAI